MRRIPLKLFRAFLVTLALFGSSLLLMAGAAESYEFPPYSDLSGVGVETASFEDGSSDTALSSGSPGGSAIIASLDLVDSRWVEVDAQGQQVEAKAPQTDEVEEYDPWEQFNEPVFTFNYKVDQHVLRPIASAYDKVVHDEIKRALDRAFDNLGFPRRGGNNLLQLKFVGTVREVARFVINSTLGIAGLFDVAKTFGIREADEDFGQTLAVWGAGNGPYLILPFLRPLTVRDGFGLLVDSLLDPVSFFIPLVARIAISVTDAINDRSLNLELFESVERATLDLYSAVRHAYLQRRAKVIRE
ncbi:MAG TPA: VacJ family lipoprotein [Methylomirabilota bacterium]|nr:VacJ family lipoprotein [Methylomirabilota bacterium]